MEKVLLEKNGFTFKLEGKVGQLIRMYEGSNPIGWIEVHFEKSQPHKAYLTYLQLNQNQRLKGRGTLLLNVATDYLLGKLKIKPRQLPKYIGTTSPQNAIIARKLIDFGFFPVKRKPSSYKYSVVSKRTIDRIPIGGFFFGKRDFLLKRREYRKKNKIS